jgi:hypothetical protein
MLAKWLSFLNFMLYNCSVYLQFRFHGLRLLQNRLHLGGLHDVALDFQFASHEQPLCIRLAIDQFAKVLV